MKIVFVTYSLPSETSNGGPMTCWGIARHLVDAGHDLTVCALVESTDVFQATDRRDRVRALGAQLDIIEHDRLVLWREAVANGAGALARRVRGRVSALAGRPELDRYYPWTRLRPRLESVLQRARPDVVLCYHFEALSATHRIEVPRVAAVGDLYHLPNYYRWKTSRARAPRYATGAFHQWRLKKIHEPLMLKMMQSCRARGAFAAHYAEWFRRRGLTDTQYFRTPIVDPVGDAWRERRAAMRQKKPRILIIGDVGTTVSVSGLRIFAETILPSLERRLGADRFEVRIVGGGTMEADTARKLDRPSVRICGRIDPPDAEFLSADVLLVPTPIDLGIRVRIVTGWAYGSRVVTHPANTAGIPEIGGEENALLGRDGEAMAEAVVRILDDGALGEKLSAGGRRTYEQWFRPEAAAAAIRTTLETVVTGSRSARL